MNKTIFVILALTIASVLGQSCSGNPLRAVFGFTALDSPKDGSNLNFCKSLKASTTCCDDSVVNDFQKKSDQLIRKLTDRVAARDRFLIKARNSVYSLKPTLERLITAYEKALPNLGSVDSDNALAVDLLATMSEAFQQLSIYIRDDITNFQANFTQYQKSRSACVVELVKTQAAAWCLACDPNYAAKGLSNSQLSFSTDLQDRILDSCYEFFSLSATQNSVISIYYMREMVNGMANAMQMVADGNFAAATQFLTRLADYVPPISDNNNELPVELPPSCNSNSCPWIFNELFKNSLVNEALLAAGGIIADPKETTSFDHLREGRDEELPGRNSNKESIYQNFVGRNLQSSSSWNPDSNEAEVEVSFEENPGKVDNNNLSAFRNGVIACALSLFIAFLF